MSTATKTGENEYQVMVTYIIQLSKIIITLTCKEMQIITILLQGLELILKNVKPGAIHAPGIFYFFFSFSFFSFFSFSFSAGA